MSHECKLNPDILHSRMRKFNFHPKIDLFATRLIKQFETFVSFKPEPEAFATDCFTIDWSGHDFYAFTPFSMISKMLKKILTDKAEYLRSSKLAKSAMVLARHENYEDHPNILESKLPSLTVTVQSLSARN